AQDKRQIPGEIPFLDASQSNITVIVNALRARRPPPPPPPAYTNVISNTNLFTPAEHDLLTALPLKYRTVTTKCGPPGTILVGVTNLSSSLTARFQYTNSDACEQVTFAGMKSARFRTADNDGYDVDVDMRNGAILNFRQIKKGVANGLLVSFYGDHCATWMRFADGKAVGKWFMWGADNSLLIQAEFKEPYDFLKHARKIKM
ncbi:MAG: hypothetical protein NT167_30820, partial [Verrucomicrobia bacterium]|nr:hypothetical protein [Verrucomicrobiota bacterium]